jgi:hypothetical protein
MLTTEQRLRDFVIHGQITRTELERMVFIVENQWTDKFADSLASLTDGQLIDLIVIQDD